mgnify:CR=1 FL=1
MNLAAESPMDAWTRINLEPALSVASVGAVVAVVATALVAMRGRGGRSGVAHWQRTLTVLTLFLTLDLVVFGAFTRLTDSGLGCPDWPGCYGESNPWAAHDDIQQAHAALPSGPVSPAKAWIEMVHRYLATGVGALLTGLMALAWWARSRPGVLGPFWPTVAWIWVCAQGAFGAATVTLKLQPIVVTGHLIGAMLGVGILSWQVQRVQPLDVARAADANVRARLLRGTLAVLVVVAVQIALGAWVSSNYAVLACAEFPSCQGQWWPEMDWGGGFHLLRVLGEDGQGGYISLAALTAIHMAHRMMAGVVTLALLGWGWALRRHPGYATQGAWLWGLLALQVASGLSNVVLGWPLASALAHTLGAALLVWRLVSLWACLVQASPSFAHVVSTPVRATHSPKPAAATP